LNFSFLDPWHLFLPREGGHLIAFMGSGGKTSLLLAFAGVYQAEGIPTILTCTTRSEPLPGVPVRDLADLDSDHSLPASFFLRDGQTEDGKWQGLAPEAVDGLGRAFPDRVVLSEVDGSAKRPLKIHRPGEPVWPRRTSLAVLVMGAAAVGGFAEQNVHRLGRQVFAPLADLKQGSVLEWDHLLALLLEPGGYLAQVPGRVPVVLALAGMAEVADSIGLFDFVGRAMEHPRLPLALFGETGGEEPSFRAGYRAGPGEANEELDEPFLPPEDDRE
jgi:probable selenium-dependent hydroxylase accessory protein YqeC